eukprot:13982556-Alexandrium_andersonii.AAC.1
MQFHEGMPSCPNCRGIGNKIAIWRYQDPSLVTQLSPDGAQAVHNLLDPVSDQPAFVARVPVAEGGPVANPAPRSPLVELEEQQAAERAQRARDAEARANTLRR